ncbi:MAG TPA: hypothetical protein VK828_06485 [Terriglobales bacterium]|nr:hypothetical protein [Terriglobales bacterium]
MIFQCLAKDLERDVRSLADVGSLRDFVVRFEITGPGRLTGVANGELPRTL